MGRGASVRSRIQKKLRRQKSREKKRKREAEKAKIAAARKEASPPKGYWYRNQILHGLGFANYYSYLNSDLWRGIRSNFLKDVSRCMICYKLNPTEVHHEFYSLENLAGEAKDGLVAVCHTCHHYIEFRHDGSKTDLEEAHQRLLWRLQRLL